MTKTPLAPQDGLHMRKLYVEILSLTGDIGVLDTNKRTKSPDADGHCGTGYIETFSRNDTKTYPTASYHDRRNIWPTYTYFDHFKHGIPPPHPRQADVRKESLVDAIDRVVRRRGTTMLRMVTYRLTPTSKSLEHRILRRTVSPGTVTSPGEHVENHTYIICHQTWTGWMHLIAESALSNTDYGPMLLVWRGLDKMRRRADVKSYFSVLKLIIHLSQHGSNSTNNVEKRVFKYLQAIRADLVGVELWDNMFQPASFAVADKTTKIDTEGCLAGGNTITRHASVGDNFVLLEDIVCGDGFTPLTGPPMTIVRCQCTGAYCQSCLERWIGRERPTCPECRKPILLSTRLQWARSKKDCGIAPGPLIARYEVVG